MFCPYCIHGKALVIDASWDHDHKTIRRKRHCLDCAFRWVTLELDLDQVEFLDEVCRKNNYHSPPQTDSEEMGQPMEDGDEDTL